MDLHDSQKQNHTKTRPSSNFRQRVLVPVLALELVQAMELVLALESVRALESALALESVRALEPAKALEMACLDS